MATPECLMKLKQRAFEKGWMLEQLPFLAMRRDYNGLLVEGYGGGVWALTRCHTEAIESTAGQLAGEIRTALANERERARRNRKKSIERGERKSRQLKRA